MGTTARWSRLSGKLSAWQNSYFFFSGGADGGRSESKMSATVFHVAVHLLFPDVHELAVVLHWLALRIFQGHQIEAHKIGQIAGTGDLYFAYLPGHGTDRTGKRGPHGANRLLAGGDGGVGRQQGASSL